MSQLSRLNRFISTFAAIACCAVPVFAQSVLTVNVDAAKPVNILTPTLVGAWSNMGDGDLTDPKGDALMKAAGITAITYPTGWEDIADLYHWSTNKLTPNAGNADAIRKPYMQGKNDFASVVMALSKFGIMPVVHVNYGSNMAGTGPGEPKEAAAWVAYANGSASDTREIGKDSTGTDWKTVGFWATIRSEEPINADDGYNFLRVNHPEPFHVQLWQVGEDVPQNGYYGGDHTGTFDLHAAYPAAKKDNGKRKKLPQLSPKTYGDQLLAYSTAMKAVDPTIQVGATLTLPVASLGDPSEGYAPDWNPTVLKTACKDIDFVSYPWHPGNSSNDEQWKTMDDGILLGALTDTLPHILAESIHEDQVNCPAGKVLHLSFSQFSQLSWPKIEHPNVLSLFIADMLATLGEDGITNANWFQLRDGGLIDANGKPTPAYYGAQMLHIVAFRPGDTYLMANNPKSLSVHATKRQDGLIGVILLNRDRREAKTVRVNVLGAGDFASAIQFDYSPVQQAAGTGPVRSTANVEGSSVTVTVPPYGIVDLLLKKK